jgi:hypothetical protein
MGLAVHRCEGETLAGGGVRERKERGGTLVGRR